jgi:hypothetical protein
MSLRSLFMKARVLLSIIASVSMMGEVLAEHHGEQPSQSVYSATSQQLVLKNIHYKDMDGNKTETMYNVTLEVSGTGPLQFTTVGGVCEAPKTWHADMNHCMVQDEVDDDRPMTDSHGCVLPETWHEAMKHCMEQ